MTILFWLMLSMSLQASSAHELIFSQDNTTYGVLVINDAFGKEFLSFFNNSLNATSGNFNTWNMNLLALEETLEKKNFFVSNARRARAVRYFGCFSNAILNASLMHLFDLANQAVPAKPQVLASRTFNSMIFAIFLPLASFSFWRIPWGRGIASSINLL
ncbi:MAG: hypothetical protein WCK42_06970 [Myxococcaceae bacterium]